MSPSKKSFAQKAVLARLAKQGRGPTLLEDAVLRAGLHRGASVLGFGVFWAIWRQLEGSELPKGERGGTRDVEAFASWAGCSRATAYRDLGFWRGAFGDVPGWETPDGLVEFLEAERSRRAELKEMAKLSKQEATVLIGALPAPGVLL